MFVILKFGHFEVVQQNLTNNWYKINQFGIIHTAKK